MLSNSGINQHLMRSPDYRERYRFEIEVDSDPPNPRDEEPLGTILYRNHPRLKLGDRIASAVEIETILNSKDYISLPVFAYHHGSIALSTTGFSCTWDSWQSGVVFVCKAKIREEWKVRAISKKLRLQVLEGLKAEVDNYSSYLNGEVYGYIVYDGADDPVDSCWGIVGRDNAEAEAKAAIVALTNSSAG